MKRAVWLVGVLLACRLVVAADAPPTCRALLAAPATGPLTLLLDGTPVALGAYGELTAWAAVAPGPHNLKLLGGTPQQLWDDRETTFESGQRITLLVAPQPPGAVLLRLLEPALPTAEAGRLRVVNLLAETGAVDVLALGQVPFATLGPRQVSRSVEPTAAERYALRPAGGGMPWLTTDVLRVGARQTVTLFAIGQPGASGEAAARWVVDTQPWPASAVAPPAAPEPIRPPPPATRLRVLHAAAGSAPRSGTLGGRPLFRDLAYGQVTPYLPLSPGAPELLVSGDPPAAQALGLQEGGSYTLLLVGEPRRLLSWLFRDEPPADPATAQVRVVQCCRQPATVDLLAGDTVLEAGLSYLQYGPYRPLPATTRRLALRPSGQDVILQTLPLVPAAGRSYTVLVCGAWAEPATAPTLRLLEDG
ncbi:MAG: DUF4397 domain-containing protein [Fimbriimonadaceae bacterium]|nr:DUF4397 domain-containing protein [Fimbriimonadaceae bacterium]